MRNKLLLSIALFLLNQVNRNGILYKNTYQHLIGELQDFKSDACTRGK